MSILKKFLLPILVVIFLVELAFFIPWAWQNGVIRDVFFFYPFHKNVINERIGDVNESLQNQITNLPQSLSEELAATRLYFMLAIKETVSIQSFVFEDGKFSDVDYDDDRDRYYGYSSDGNKAAFFAVPKDKRDTLGSWGEEAVLYVSDASAPDNPAFPPLESAQAIDSTNIPHKQHPDVSNDGKVLFLGWEHERAPGVEDSEDWSIYLASGSQTELLTKGFMPKWISDTEFVFLRNDGLYLANTELTVLKRLATSTEPVIHSNNRFDISDDGKLIAWTQPHLPQVFIYTIEEDRTLVLKKSILAKAFWASFSPSSNYLALETINLYAGGMEEKPQAKIEFYDMNTFMKVPELEIDFDLFDQMNMYMTDWVLK